MNNTTRDTLALGLALATLAFACVGAAHAQTVGLDGIIRVRSDCPVDETVARIRADIAAKGILFFQADRKMPFDTATGVVQSIASTVMAK